MLCTRLSRNIAQKALKFFSPLTLSRGAPSAVSKGWGGADWAPPRILRVLGWFWFQILVAASDLTKIDTRQKDLQLSDAQNHSNYWSEKASFLGASEVCKGTPYEKQANLTNFHFFWENSAILLSGKCCPLFHLRKRRKKIRTPMRIHTLSLELLSAMLTS